MPTEKPRWMHGYRTHGFWLGDTRIGYVSLPPGRRVKSYGWGFEPPHASSQHGRVAGTSADLKKVKRIVERLYKEHLEMKKNGQEEGD